MVAFCVPFSGRLSIAFKGLKKKRPCFAHRKRRRATTRGHPLELRPASQIYGTSVPQAIRLSASNFYGNLQEPKRFVNHLGQAEFIKATTDVTRFVINSSVFFLLVCLCWAFAGVAVACFLLVVLWCNGIGRSSLRDDM